MAQETPQPTVEQPSEEEVREDEAGQPVSLEELVAEFGRLQAQVDTNAGDQLILLAGDQVAADRELYHALMVVENGVRNLARVIAAGTGEDTGDAAWADVDPVAEADRFVERQQVGSMVRAVNYLRSRVTKDRLVVPGS